jgi:hypothetical protein
MKKVFLFCLLAASVNMTFAQISTRENVEPYVFKTGTRPEAGTWGLWVGPSVGEIIDMADSETTWRGFPLINVKYYQTDHFVYRAGIQFYRLADKQTSKVDAEVAADSEAFKDYNSEAYFRITPGIEYHFSPKNLLDVYVGANLPLGFDRYANKQKVTLGSDVYTQNVTHTPFVWGIGGFVGLQVFVADLPFAIGLEYGLSVISRAGDQYKYTIVDNGKKEVFYGTNQYGDDGFTKMYVGKSTLGNDFRVTFSYFFNK